MAPASPLDDLVCFAMYTASHATSQAYREVLRPWDLTYTQYLVLVVLADGERSVSALAEELGLDSGTVSPLLRRLVDRGLVARRRDAADERVVRVDLTAEGARVRAEVADGVACLIPAFTDGATDLRALVDGLRGVAEQMRAITAARRAS